MLKPEVRKRAAVSAVLDPDPGKLGVQIVAAVDVDRARSRPVREHLAALDILGPNRSSEAVRAVVHQPDSLVFAIDRHDPNDRPKAFFLHYAHAVIDVHQHAWLEKVPRSGQAPSAGEDLGAAANGLSDLGFDKVHTLALGQRSQGG